MDSVKPIPDGYPTATPHLTVSDGDKALAFYQKAFGAKETLRLTLPDGKIGYAAMIIGTSPIMLADEFPGMGNSSPHTLAGSTVGIHLYVEEVDAFIAQAAEAGAEVLEPATDQFHGDRMGKLKDPFGHIWTVATHQEDISNEEIIQRFQALFQD